MRSVRWRHNCLPSWEAASQPPFSPSENSREEAVNGARSNPHEGRQWWSQRTNLSRVFHGLKEWKAVEVIEETNRFLLEVSGGSGSLLGAATTSGMHPLRDSLTGSRSDRRFLLKACSGDGSIVAALDVSRI